MRDWEALVRCRLTGLALDPAEKAEVIAELAAHLEQICEEFRRHGMAEEEALQRTLSQVDDWQDLARKISLVKPEEENVNIRTKCFWLPGLVNFTASMVWLMILQLSIGQVRMPWVRDHVLAATYVAWLVAQPLFGGLGAYMSRRAGGERQARLAAGLFPSIAFLAIFFWVAVIALFVERNHFVLDHPVYFTMVVFPWVILPATALLAGALPFLKRAKVREA